MCTRPPSSLLSFYRVEVLSAKVGAASDPPDPSRLPFLWRDLRLFMTKVIRTSFDGANAWQLSRYLVGIRPSPSLSFGSVFPRVAVEDAFFREGRFRLFLPF